MSWLETLHTLLLSPWLLLPMTMVLVAGWTLRRKHFYLLWMAAGIGFWAWAKHHQIPSDSWADHMQAVYLYWLGACCMAQSIAMRFGRTASFYVVIGASLCLLLAVGLFVYLSPNSFAYAWLATWALAAILGHVLPVVWRSAKRHQAERGLQWVYSALVIWLALAPWQATSPWALLSSNSVVLMPLMTALGLALLASALCDGAAGVRTDVHSDPITGVLNRVGFEKNCGALPSEKGITVVVLCELDHFARFEQQFGSHAAHAVLCHFAYLLQSSVREGDLLARIGGQEFGLALRDMALHDAHALVKRINVCLRQQHWANKAKQGPITASFSVAEVREQDSLKLALHRADVLLCQAKDDGASSVVVGSRTGSAVATFS